MERLEMERALIYRERALREEAHLAFERSLQERMYLRDIFIKQDSTWRYLYRMAKMHKAHENRHKLWG